MLIPPPPHHAIGAALTAVALLAPAPVAAQEPSPAAAPPIADSAQAVATACAVAQGLRPAAERYRCQVDRYAETSTEYIVWVREDPAPGASPLVFSRSEVRLNKTEPLVIVTRAPEL
ncbi:MAG TPA: hypothetical protein VFG66_11955 [Gemmatimonadales bacterium]|nr:hypothetical protein [Gemmatimonadales bacterium]